METRLSPEAFSTLANNGSRWAECIPPPCYSTMHVIIKCHRTRTFSLLLPDDALALPVQELQMVGHHSLLAFVDDFGVGAGVQVFPASHFLIFQPR